MTIFCIQYFFCASKAWQKNIGYKKCLSYGQAFYKVCGERGNVFIISYSIAKYKNSMFIGYMVYKIFLYLLEFNKIYVI